MKTYKLAIFSLVAGFATAAFATDGASVSERKSCDEIAAEIAELSAIESPDADTTKQIEELKKMQRTNCTKRAGVRSSRSIAKSRTQIKTSENTDTATEQNPVNDTEPVDNTCETPDENGCCPGEIYMDMGELGFNCCPETGGDCFPPIKVSVESDTEPVPELTDEQRIENINNGLCADGSAPNKYGCCNDEVFKDLGNLTFACCPKSGGDCFPPIKQMQK
ncbi:MAG: hypothetical protein J6L70_00990 [Alphaproteobacteria bacterium]|nr:hypothetical protein [Alphaproteobacteria bacterium]